MRVPIRLSKEDTLSVVSTLTPSSTFGTEDAPQDVSLALHPVPSHPGLIAKIQPPTAPADPSLPRTPCDIVLVIDVSGSMHAAAPVPGGGDKGEDYGFSILDLTKHAALTILETLGEEDRLGIVTFSQKAEVLMTMQPVDDRHKKKCREEILLMRPLMATNLWKGIQTGLELFEGSKMEGRNPALLVSFYVFYDKMHQGVVSANDEQVLTDGMPNMQCPPQGYVPKLQQMSPLPAAIHTFGFGYDLKSGLLKSIADVGGGSYSYIPDSSMLVGSPSSFLGTHCRNNGP